MVNGTQQEIREGYSKKYTGFAQIEVVAVSPTREELNDLLGVEGKEDDKPKTYKDTDKDGNDRVRLEFWLHNKKLNKYFTYSVWITNQIRKSKDGLKTLYTNNALDTLYWPDEATLPESFKNFLSKTKEVIGVKEVREAYSGEDQLNVFLKAWLGRLNFFKADTNVVVNISKILDQDFSELRSLIDGAYSTPFIVLVGLETDAQDPTKQHVKIFGKKFLPNNFWEFIENPKLLEKNEYAREKIWAPFQKESKGQYGFQAYYKEGPISEYDPEDNIAAKGVEKKDVTTTNKKY